MQLPVFSIAKEAYEFVWAERRRFWQLAIPGHCETVYCRIPFDFDVLETAWLLNQISGVYGSPSIRRRHAYQDPVLDCRSGQRTGLFGDFCNLPHCVATELPYSGGKPRGEEIFCMRQTSNKVPP